MKVKHLLSQQESSSARDKLNVVNKSKQKSVTQRMTEFMVGVGVQDNQFTHWIFNLVSVN